MSQQQTQESLQQRVGDILRGNPLASAREESIDVIFSLLQRAEEELKAVQERVDLLKREWEKAQS